MLISRNIQGPRGNTSMRLEKRFWDGFQEICRREGLKPSQLVAKIDEERSLASGGLRRTEAIRVYILTYFQRASTEEGHSQAGHGDIMRPPRRRENQSSLAA